MFYRKKVPPGLGEKKSPPPPPPPPPRKEKNDGVEVWSPLG